MPGERQMNGYQDGNASQAHGIRWGGFHGKLRQGADSFIAAMVTE